MQALFCRNKPSVQWWAFTGSEAARDCSPPSQCRFSGRDGLRAVPIFSLLVRRASGFTGRDGARPSRGKMVRNHHWSLDQDLQGARSLGAALLDAGEDARFTF